MIIQEKVKGEVNERKKPLTTAELLEQLRDHCRNSYATVKRAPIFVKDTGPDAMLVSPLEKDLATSYWIDKLVQPMPSWQRYPSRWRCLKGYTVVGESREDEGKSVYAVIPYDGTKLGVASQGSFYRSFSKIEKEFEIHRLDNVGMNQWIGWLTSSVKKLSPDAKVNTDAIGSFRELTLVMKQLDTLIATKGNDLRGKLVAGKVHLEDQEKRALEDLFKRRITSIEAYLSEKLDPESNGFSLARIESYHHTAQNREVWFNAPCVMIKRDHYIELFKAGKIK